MPVGRREQGVDVGLVEQLAADRLAGAAFEQDVVGHDDRGAAVDLSSVLTCWRKLSCLLLVVAQKSSRTIVSDSLLFVAPSLMIVMLRLLAERRIGEHHS